MGLAEKIFSEGIDPDVWEANNKPDSNLICGGGQLEQINNIKAVGALSQLEPKIVGEHYSSSVKLPVSCFLLEAYNEVGAYVFVRDNFYDIKCCVMSEVPVDIPMNVVHCEVDEKWLKDQISRYMNYTGKPKPKDDSWYIDWSEGEIIRERGRIYRATGVRSVFCEGIDRLGLSDEIFRVYRPGSAVFSASISSYPDLAYVIQCIRRSFSLNNLKLRERVVR